MNINTLKTILEPTFSELVITVVNPEVPKAEKTSKNICVALYWDLGTKPLKLSKLDITTKETKPTKTTLMVETIVLIFTVSLSTWRLNALTFGRPNTLLIINKNKIAKVVVLMPPPVEAGASTNEH